MLKECSEMKSLKPIISREMLNIIHKNIGNEQQNCVVNLEIRELSDRKLFVLARLYSQMILFFYSGT